MSEDYERFVSQKLAHTEPAGFDVVPELHPRLFDFQRDIVAWALRRGRAAVFADTGLGKSSIELVWGDAVAKRCGRPVLILAPLAVAAQTEREARLFDIPARVVSEQDGVGDGGIYITNYEKIHRFDPSAFGGVVLDESSLLKNYSGASRTALIEAFGRTPYRLACTATPAPNDFTELGNHAEFLGVRPRSEMLAEFFVHDGGSTQDWRIKGHAVDAFWRWVSTWAAVVRRPSDLGYEDGGFNLPPLNVHEHVLPLDQSFARKAGVLFVKEAESLTEQRAVRRASIEHRVRALADLVAAEPDEQWLIWCELNDEGDALERAIPDAVQVSGSDTNEQKEERILAFADRRVRVLVSKPDLCGFGVNLQRCARVAFVGVGHSFERYYQAIRRCWRFGQARPVDVHVVCTDADRAILENLKRKERDAMAMSLATSSATADLTRAAIRATAHERKVYAPSKAMKIPAWLKSA